MLGPSFILLSHLMIEPQLILAADVGNSRAKLGVFEVVDEELPEPLAFTAIPLSDSGEWGELDEWLEAVTEREINRSILSGSNPEARDRLVNSWPTDPPQLITDYAQVPLQLDVDSPETVGIDRLLSCFAARQLVSREAPLIVVDSGTATTINLVTADGCFRGGAILPGLRMSARSLHDYTARLPLVDADEFFVDDTVDAPLPGRNTQDAMKAGLFWGQLGAIREISQALTFSAMMQSESAQPPQLVLTGGGGRQLVNELADATHIDCLTLHALAMLSLMS